MSTTSERIDSAMLHPELLGERDPDAILRDGRRLTDRTRIAGRVALNFTHLFNGWEQT